ncbi:hypothetical protein SDC9_122289 [bioreactor metagenome]|uniref:Metallo-beta-lactamase domain-containing protein n=1 Tax=bioreactor metagenome TaxID=1076179 RepID=A0A645CEB2_9ZZZZ
MKLFGTVSRNIYPVGQGGFSSEIHHDCDGKINFVAVYDCGVAMTGTNSSKNFNQKTLVDEFLVDSNNTKIPIDILFISHFDQDHVSLIKALIKDRAVKRVIVPLMRKWKKKIIALCAEGWDTQLLTNPKDFFNLHALNSDTIITEVSALTDNEYNSEIDNAAADAIQIPSGNSISSNTNWHYIPFNIEPERSDCFEEKCKESDIEIDKLTEDDLCVKAKQLKKIYQELSGGINQNSLLLYSAPDYSNKTVETLQCPGTFCCGGCCKKLACDASAGCLYTGDYDYSHMEKLKVFFVSKNLIGNIGTL